MYLLKNILSHYLNIKAEEFNVSIEDWENYGSKITRKDANAKTADKRDMYAMVPLEWGETGLKKRLSFAKKGNVYMNIDCTTDLVLNLFCSHLKSKL